MTPEMCPGHPDQPRIHCACEAGRALYPCPDCKQLRAPVAGHVCEFGGEDDA